MLSDDEEEKAFEDIDLDKSENEESYMGENMEKIMKNIGEEKDMSDNESNSE